MNRWLKIVLFILGLIILLITLFVIQKPAGAIGGGHVEVCICHNKHNPHTVCSDMASILEGHGNHLRSGFDKWGKCPEPEPTPTPKPKCTPTPKPSAIPTPTPTIPEKPKYHFLCREYQCVQVEGEGESECKVDKDCEEPQPTPTPEYNPDPDDCGAEARCAGPASPPACLDTTPIGGVDNPHLYRIGDLAQVKWLPDRSKSPLVHIYYYENQNPDNQHAVRDTDNDGYELIGFLGNLDWTFGIQPANGCAAGEIQWIEDGVTSKPRLFRP